MTIPEDPVRAVESPIPGLWHGTVYDGRIDFRSETFAVRSGAGEVVWIDPLPMADAALECWPEPDAILISGRCHQRDAWALRRRTGVPVWGPEGIAGTDEPPDRLFGSDTALPGGLTGHPGVGPTTPHALFEWDHGTFGRIAYVGDLWIRRDAEAFRPVPVDHRDESEPLLRRLESEDWSRFAGLLTAHGAPCFRMSSRQFDLST